MITVHFSNILTELSHKIISEGSDAMVLSERTLRNCCCCCCCCYCTEGLQREETIRLLFLHIMCQQAGELNPVAISYICDRFIRQVNLPYNVTVTSFQNNSVIGKRIHSRGWYLGSGTNGIQEIFKRNYNFTNVLTQNI